MASSTPLVGLVLLVGLVVGAAGPPEAPTPPRPVWVVEVAEGLARDVTAAASRYAAGLAGAVVRLGTRAVPSDVTALL